MEDTDDIINEVSNEIMKILRFLNKPSEDSMGYDIIVYWPSIPWMGNEENEEAAQV